MMTEDRPAFDVRKMDQAVAKAVSEANQLAKPQPDNYPPEYRFVKLADQLCDAMLEASRHQLALAESNMKKTEMEVEKIRQDAKRRWDEYDAYVRGLEDFGMTLLDANKKFQKGNGR